MVGMMKKINYYEVLLWSFVISVMLTITISCGVTKTTTHGCELMKNGQKCLSDHSCCK